MSINKDNVVKTKKLVMSVIMSGVLVVLLCFSTKSNVYIINTLCLWILGWLYLSIYIYKITSSKSIEYMHMKDVIINKAVTFVISALIIVVFPIKYGDVLTHNYWEKQMSNSREIIITPLDSANENATAKEIWIEEIFLDYKRLDINSLNLPNGWVILENRLYTANASTAEKLTIDISNSKVSEVIFAATEASGMVNYVFGESGVDIDLYSSERKRVQVEPETIWGRINEAPAINRLIYYGAYVIVLWIILDGIWLCFWQYNYKRKNA